MIKKKVSREAAVFLLVIFTMTQIFCLSPGIASADTTWETVGNPGFSAGGTWGVYGTKIALDSNDIPYVVFADTANESKATVMKFNGTNWGTVGDVGFSEGYAGYTALAINSDDVPYVVFVDDGIGAKATVMKYDGTSWVTVGAAGFTSESTMNTSIALDSSDTPYIVFSDSDNDNKATVMKYNGTGWVTVGNAGFSVDQADFDSIAIDSNDIPYVVFKDWGIDQKASVMKFNGTNWESAGETACSAGQAGYSSIAIGSDDTPYVVFRDHAHGAKATVMMLNGTTWVPVGETGFSAGDLSYPSIAISNSNTPYVAYVDDANDYKATVMKFNGTSWVTVGDAGFSEGKVGYTSIAADSDGNPYVVYRDNANAYRATVMRYIALSYDAETPAIITQPADAAVTVGEAVYLSVEASVTTGDLSYQWYSSTIDSNNDGTIIDEATDNSYSPPTAQVGTSYYYCIVTNTDNSATGNTTAAAVSDAAEVVVTDSEVTPGALAITTASLPDGKVNRSYSKVLEASGGTEPYTWNITGLPSGLDINTVTGEVYGIPESAGTSSVAATVYDSNSSWDLATFNLTVRRPSSTSSSESSSSSVKMLKIITDYLPEGTAGKFYSQTVSASGGTEPYTWSSTGLPEGLSLSSDGLISGIPAEEGISTLVLEISDRQNRKTSSTLTLSVNPAPLTNPPEAILTDIAGHWAENNIKQIVSEGIISGYPDKTFLPDKEITRAEFVTMLVKAFKLDQKEGPGFADVSGHWASADIETTAFYGIVDGYDSNFFGPDDFITREQVAVMIVRALELIQTGEETTFNDRGSISPWARTAVATAVCHNLMTGYPDNTFRPSAFTTRAEAATIIHNALHQE